MRVAGPLLTLSAVLIAGAALAQGSGYYNSGSPYTWDRYEYYPPPQGQMWQGPMHHCPIDYGQWQQNHPRQPGPQWHMRSDSMWQGPRGAYPPPQAGTSVTGQKGPTTSGPVSFATQSQIKTSLESSGFKDITILSQSYLIRATAPDGSRIVMQVSADSLDGVVVNPPDHGGSSGTAGSPSTGNTSSGTSNTSSTGATGGAGGASSAGSTTSSGTEQNTSR